MRQMDVHKIRRQGHEFGGAGRDAALISERKRVTRFQITIDSTGEIFHCGPETNVLEAMEAALCKGIPVGCRNGGCGACKARVVRGPYLTHKMNRAVVSEGGAGQGIRPRLQDLPAGRPHARRDRRSGKAKGGIRIFDGLAKHRTEEGGLDGTNWRIASWTRGDSRPRAGTCVEALPGRAWTH